MASAPAIDAPPARQAGYLPPPRPCWSSYPPDPEAKGGEMPPLPQWQDPDRKRKGGYGGEVRQPPDRLKMESKRSRESGSLDWLVEGEGRAPHVPAQSETPDPYPPQAERTADVPLSEVHVDTPSPAGDISLADVAGLFAVNDPYRIVHLARSRRIFTGPHGEERRRNALRYIDGLLSSPRATSLTIDEASAIVEADAEDYID